MSLCLKDVTNRESFNKSKSRSPPFKIQNERKTPQSTPKRSDRSQIFKSVDNLKVEKKEKETLSEGKTQKRRSKIQCRFQNRIPATCDEAIRAHRFGSVKLAITDAPGLPTKKFSYRDLKKFGESKVEWPVQAIYDIKKPNHCLVVYEGWTTETSAVMKYEDLIYTAHDRIKVCKLRKRIVEEIFKQTGRKHNWEKLKAFPNNLQWCFEDLSYYHSLINEQVEMAPVFYLCSNYKSIVSFPKYNFITENIVTRDVKESLEDNEKTKYVSRIIESIEEIENGHKSSPARKKKVCSSTDCKCDLTLEVSYKSIKSLFISMNSNGLLEFQKWQISNGGFTIECSDTCGCDRNCKTRNIQKGQKIPLAVTYEGEKGFGVRAGAEISKGEFITEYCGLVHVEKDVQKSEAYMIECSMTCQNSCIDASEFGNISRYFNHSCDANSMFIEVHSRKNEKDVLIPRVGIYAIKKIKIGEEITVSYWPEDHLQRLKNVSKSQKTSCKCGKEKCLGWLPLC